MLTELVDFTPPSNLFIDTDIKEGQSGGGVVEETYATPDVLPDFYLSNAALHNISIYTGAFGDPFDTLTWGILLQIQLT